VVQVGANAVAYVHEWLGVWMALATFESDLLADIQKNVMGNKYYEFALSPVSTEISNGQKLTSKQFDLKKICRFER